MRLDDLTGIGKSGITGSTVWIIIAAVALLFGGLVGAPESDADSIQLAWDASPATDLAGYKLYRSTQAGVYGSALSTLGTVATASVPAPNLAVDTTYFFTVTAFDTSGNESLKSNEVSKLVPAQATPPPPPAGIATITAPATDGMVFPSGPLLPVASTGPAGTTRNLYVDITNDARPRALIPPQFTSVLTAGSFTDEQGGTFSAGCTTCPYVLIVEYVSGSTIVAAAQRTYTLGAVTPPPPPPAVDTDGDGVPDSTDQCPTQAGPASNNGCPVVVPPPPPPVVDGVKIVSDTNRQVVVNIGACPVKATGASGVTTARSGSGANRKITITCTTVP